MAGVLMAAGCERSSVAPDLPADGTPLPSPAALTTVPAGAVTAAALAALGADGRFERTASAFPTPFPIMSAAQAETVAVRFLRVHGSAFNSDFSEDRGETVRSERLTSCGPALYGDSPLSPVPDSIIVNLRITMGPAWEVLLCDGGVQQVVVGVGAYATDLVGFDFNAPTGSAGSELLNASLSWRGIPVGVRYPASAEEAAARVAAATGRKVVSVPRLVRGRIPLSKWWTLWSVDLDSAVTVRGLRSNVSRSRSTLMYGLLPAARWEMAVVDATHDELGPYVTTGEIRQPDGSQRTIPLTLGRLPAPSFLNAAPVVRVTTP
ncbi:MAG: hypothetical protein HYX65_08295 [Gemmatimonadetes bacterium]|nr:hypothetical protein [Gemmatimonadota bacterium]